MATEMKRLICENLNSIIAIPVPSIRSKIDLIISIIALVKNKRLIPSVCCNKIMNKLTIYTAEVTGIKTMFITSEKTDMYEK